MEVDSEQPRNLDRAPRDTLANDLDFSIADIENEDFELNGRLNIAND
jgi:hypothetical protein